MIEPLALARLTWPEARALFNHRTVAILPTGSTEPHGPHLPLDVDVTIALTQAWRAAARLGELDVPTLVLPAIPFGVTFFTEGFAGRVGIHPGTLWSLIEDIVESLSEQGLRRVVISNGHLEGDHVKVLRGLALDYEARSALKAQVLFPDNTRRRWAAMLGEEFKSGDCHAGRYETSIVLAADPDGVREAQRQALAPVAVDLIARTRAGAKSFREIGAADAYCGDPAAASAAEGEERIHALANMIVESTRETWPELFAAPDQPVG